MPNKEENPRKKNKPKLYTERKLPQRRCTGCGESKDKRDLIRVVRIPVKEGEPHVLEIDRRGKKSGRGAYICPEAACLAKAIKTRRLERSLAVPVTPEIVAELERQIGETSDQ